MKRAVVWSDGARDDYLYIIRFIAQANPDAAERVADTIDRVVANLGDMATGRPGRVTGTYEKVVPGLPYIIAYALDDQLGRSRVAVLHVIHGARDWPDEDWPGQIAKGRASAAVTGRGTAHLVAKDAKNDLALLRLDAKPAAPLTRPCSARPRCSSARPCPSSASPLRARSTTG